MRGVLDLGTKAHGCDLDLWDLARVTTGWAEDEFARGLLRGVEPNEPNRKRGLKTRKGNGKSKPYQMPWCFLHRAWRQRNQFRFPKDPGRKHSVPAKGTAKAATHARPNHKGCGETAALSGSGK